jgi:putative RNA 2'-phosphotransferase
MAKKHLRKVTRLGLLMSYILGNKPYEYGLVPDREGYIALKDLLKAIGDEPAMGYVRESHVREVLLHDRDGTFAVDGKRIRSTQRSFSAVNREQKYLPPPKILFKGVKRKTYAHVLESGLLPGAKEFVEMTSDKGLALRVARRYDQDPIVVEVRAGAANKKGIPFYPFGDSLYLADSVPPSFIIGPPPPKEASVKKESGEKREGVAPGSFVLKAERDPDFKRRRSISTKTGWKRAAKKGKKIRRAGLKGAWREESYL